MVTNKKPNNVSCSVVPDSLRPHVLKHTRPPSCPLPDPGVYPTHVHWVSDAIQPSHPLSPPSPPTFQSFPASGFFQMSQFFASSGQSFGVSASASLLPMNVQDWFPLGWTGWISLQSKRLSRALQHHRSKASILWCSAFFIVQLSHPYMTTGKTKLQLHGPLLAKWCLCFLICCLGLV